MKRVALRLALLLAQVVPCLGQPGQRTPRLEAEYYVATYAKHYGLPVGFVRAVVHVESGWQPCVVSGKGAVGLMQLMPLTAARLGVLNRCDLNANISGGTRYLASLSRRFAGDLRLVAAAYIAGEEVIARRGLLYRNPEVFAYVSRIRRIYSIEIGGGTIYPAAQRTVR